MRTLIFPWPPSTNHAYENRKGGGRRLSDIGRQFKETAALIALAAGVRQLHGEVAITIYYYRPRKAGDVDNFGKLLRDSLQGIAYANDNQITELHEYRRDDKLNPRAEVAIGLAINQP